MTKKKIGRKKKRGPKPRWKIEEQRKREERRLARQEFIENFTEIAREVHEKLGHNLDFSKTVYTKSNEKVCITCPIHGDYWIRPDALVKLGRGCPYCNGTVSPRVKKKTQESFIAEAKTIHGEKYDYSECVYVNSDTKVKIICHKKDKNGEEHGAFWQRPDTHIHRKHGCPKCKNEFLWHKRVTKLEQEMIDFLQDNGLIYTPQKTFSWLTHGKSLDFYLQEYNVAIECQGEQHFDPRICGEERFKKQVKNDTIKREECTANGVKLFYYANHEREFPYEVFTNKTLLLKEIQKLPKIPLENAVSNCVSC